MSMFSLQSLLIFFAVTTLVTTTSTLHTPKLRGEGTLRPSSKTRSKGFSLKLKENQKLEHVRNLNKLLIVFDPDCIRETISTKNHHTEDSMMHLILSDIKSQYTCLKKVSNSPGSEIYRNPRLQDFHVYLEISDTGSCLDTFTDYEANCIASVDYEPLVRLTKMHDKSLPYGGFNETTDTSFYLWNLDAIDGKLDNYTFSLNASEDIDAKVDIYVMDEGIVGSHNEFSELHVTELNTYPNVTVTGTHGTHVSGIIIGNTVGVAKGLSTKQSNITLYSWNLYPDEDDFGDALYYQQFEDGMMTIVNKLNHTSRRGVINLSIGWFIDGSDSTDDIPWTTEQIEAYFGAMVDAGGISVAAAGNEFSDACETHPAALGNTITVGSISRKMTNEGSFEVSFFSNYGDCVDLYAPGRFILSADYSDDDDYAVYSGTSQAAPFVSGIIVQMLTINNQLSFDDILDILTRPENSIVAGSCPNQNNQTYCNQIKFESLDDLIDQALFPYNLSAGNPAVEIPSDCSESETFLGVFIYTVTTGFKAYWDLSGFSSKDKVGFSAESGSVCVNSQAEPCFTFFIEDLCCVYDLGCCSDVLHYAVYDINSTILFQGNDFGYNASTTFCIGQCVKVEVFIQHDRYSDETEWTLTGLQDNTLYGQNNAYFIDCIDESSTNKCFEFTITDSEDDGICCAYGNGYYNISINGETVVGRRYFQTSSETTIFCLNSSILATTWLTLPPTSFPTLLPSQQPETLDLQTSTEEPLTDLKTSSLIPLTSETPVTSETLQMLCRLATIATDGESSSKSESESDGGLTDLAWWVWILIVLICAACFGGGFACGHFFNNRHKTSENEQTGNIHMTNMKKDKSTEHEDKVKRLHTTDVEVKYG